MKRGFLFLAALVAAMLCTTSAEAQFGIRGGVNLTRFVGGDAGNVEGKTGLSAGGSFRLFSLGPIAIVPEIFYAQKGAVIDEIDGDARPARLDFSLSYLEVPVLAKLSLPIPGARALRPYLAAGPAFAWKLDCGVDVEGDATASARDCGAQFGDARTAFRSADRGVVAGGGIDLGIPGLGAVNLDARLVRGLARLSEGEGAQPDLRNQSFSLMLGYSIGR
jgi:hypothetical protein